MPTLAEPNCRNDPAPKWVPGPVLAYLAHVDSGRSIRSIAREAGCHASTILRQVRRYEMLRDDPLIDLALRRLSVKEIRSGQPTAKTMGADELAMGNTLEVNAVPDDAKLKQEAPRILRRLNETGACLAIAEDMENAVVVRETPDGRTLRTAVVERSLAEAMALKDWIVATGEGRIKKYRINSAGRMALKRFMAEEEAIRIGLGEAAAPFTEQHRDWAKRNATSDKNKRKGIRYNASESPLTALARRRDRHGKPFLIPDLVAAGERLREDFELAQMGQRITQNWDSFLTAGIKSSGGSDSGGGGSARAHQRVTAALKDLGPGLGDVALRCCCFLEGMEAVEEQMGWSARSGKIVLRIALLRLSSHYEEEGGNWSPLIG